MANRVKEALKVGIDDPVHSLRFAYSDHQGIQRIVLAAPGPKTVREPKEVFLIDLVQYGSGGLRDFIDFEAQSHTPADRCVRFAVAVIDNDATLATGRPAIALPVPVFHRLERASFA